MANSVKKDPRFEEILFTQEQLEKRIKELASWVNKTYKGSKDLILVGLLKGSIPFMAQLIKDIKVEHMLDFIIASSYSGDTKSTGNVKLEPAGAASESGFYIRAAAAGSAKVTTAGWVEPSDPIESSGDAYYTLPTTSFGNAGVSGKTYEDIDAKAPVLVEGGYLYIGEGYIRDSKISLAKLVPDHGTLPAVDAKSEWLYKGYSAYNNDGKLIAGTMGDAVLSDISATNVKATVSTVSVAAN